MSRQLKPISVAIRNLFASHGKGITHAEAVPLLAEIGKKEGFDVATLGPSEEFLTMNSFQIDWDNEDSVKSVADHCNIDADGIQRALAFRAWKRQEAAFNAVKHTWLNQGGKNQSKAKSVKKESKVKVAKSPAPMPSVDNLDEISALKYVESVGTLGNVQDMLTKAKAEVAYLSKVLELCENLNARLQHASGTSSKKSKVA